MKRCVPVLLLAAVIAAMFLLPGCGKKITEADISYAGPMVDNMLAGIKDKDYKEYTKDFSSVMLKAVTEDSFNQLVDLVQSKIGDYQSRTFSGAQNTKSNGVDMTVVVYKAKYTNETSDVLITVTFGEENGAMKVMGFFLNSPNLRK